MSKTIAITVSNAAHKSLTDVQEKMTKIRQAKIPGASKVNQAEALEWVLTHTLMPISDFQGDSEGVE
jgi:hypothetical protein